MKVCITCSHGGHYTEMQYMMGAFEGCDLFFITYDSPRTKIMPYRRYLFPNFGQKPPVLLLHLHKLIYILIKERPDIIVSNGAEVAIPVFYIGKLLGMRTAFIETFTRIDDPTVTGKLVYPVSDLFVVLWPEMLSKYGKKARYHGGLLSFINKKGVPEEEIPIATGGGHRP